MMFPHMPCLRFWNKGLRLVDTAQRRDGFYGNWLGREGSNLRMSVPKTDALPLGDAPTEHGV